MAAGRLGPVQPARRWTSARRAAGAARARDCARAPSGGAWHAVPAPGARRDGAWPTDIGPGDPRCSALADAAGSRGCASLARQRRARDRLGDPDVVSQPSGENEAVPGSGTAELLERDQAWGSALLLVGPAGIRFELAVLEVPLDVALPSAGKLFPEERVREHLVPLDVLLRLRLGILGSAGLVTHGRLRSRCATAPHGAVWGSSWVRRRSESSQAVDSVGVAWPTLHCEWPGARGCDQARGTGLIG